jgi:hypothetical protein
MHRINLTTDNTDDTDNRTISGLLPWSRDALVADEHDGAAADVE